MDDAWRRLIEQVHASGRRVVLAITGGGSGAIGQLLRVPGASRTLLEAIVPYDGAALAQYLAGAPDQACSEETAVAMARRAQERARALAPEAAATVGLGATASLASDRPKKGDHRCHIAVATEQGLDVTSIVLEKDRRDRGTEEDIVARVIVTVLARACGIAAPSTASLLDLGDRFTEGQRPPPDLLAQLLAGAIDRLTSCATVGSCAARPPHAPFYLARSIRYTQVTSGWPRSPRAGSALPSPSSCRSPTSTSLPSARRR